MFSLKELDYKSKGGFEVTQTSNFKKVIVFIAVIAVICGLFAGAVILNTQGEAVSNR